MVEPALNQHIAGREYEKFTWDTELGTVVKVLTKIFGGEIRALDRPTSNFRVRVVAVPDVPYNSGGSKVMGSGVNLKFYNSREAVHADGRTVKLLSYNAVYHTNKIRFIADHAQGDTTEVLIKMESYMA